MPSPELSLVLPTHNEAANLRTLVPQLFAVLMRSRIAAEIIVVDDHSPDGTAAVARMLQKRFPQLRLLERPRKLGLSSAVLAGFARARAPVVAAMDADHSHPPAALPQLFAAVRAGADVAIGSRLVPGGRIQHFPAHRMLISRSAALLARPLTRIDDPMSGYFLCRRALLRAKLNPRGFKVLLELLVKAKPARVAEIPIMFRARAHGHSKLGSRQIVEYLLQLCRLYAFNLQRK